MISYIFYRYNFLYIALCVITVLQVQYFHLIYQHKGCSNPKPMVAFLDIGQGDSIYIQDSLGVSVLIDTGPKDNSLISKIQEVTKCNIVNINTLILTHPDADHIGEAERLIKKGLVHEVLHNGFMDINQGDETMMENRLEDLSVSKRKMSAGEVLYLKNIDLQILYPIDQPYKTKVKKGKVDDNIYSISLKINAGNKSFLLTGDAPISVEKKLIEKYGKNLDSDVLKLGHHGSKFSTDQDFLSIVSPDEVIVSAGLHNKYNHPNQETLSRVKDQQSKKPLRIRETFTEGSIVYLLETD